MTKKILALALAAILALGTCSALGGGTAEPQASTTLSSYSVFASTGSNSGEVDFSFSVKAKRIADSVGVSEMKIYTSSGSYVTTVTGTTSNGLIVNNSSMNMNTYTYTGTPGVSYYALVTVFAEIGSDYDEHTVHSGSATAKYP